MAQIKVGQYTILFDDCDFDLLSCHQWRIAIEKRTSYNIAYAMTTIENTTIRMHNLILPLENSELVIDHKDCNGLNNQRSNLQRITQAQNTQKKRIGNSNTSGYKGVSYDKKRAKYYAYIQVNGKSMNLGRYEEVEQAAKAYNRAVHQYFGEFANLNEV